MQDILINWAPQETRVAVVENGAIQELHVERALERGLVGNVYAGRVARVLPGMQSAFVDIGLDRAAFLHANDVQRPAPVRTVAPDGGPTGESKADFQLDIEVPKEYQLPAEAGTPAAQDDAQLVAGA